MEHAIRKFELVVFIALLTVIASTDSLTCFKCATGKCDTLEEEVCAAAPAAGAAAGAETTAAPAAARFIELDDPPASAAPAAAGPAAFQCVTLTGKAKAGGEELVLRGCSPDGKCTLFEALVEPGGKCDACGEDKCNYGEHIKPTAFSLLMFIAIGCIALSHS